MGSLDFHSLNSSGRTIALGLSRPLTEMSTRGISWGQGRLVRGADNLTTLMCSLFRNPGSLNFLEPLGHVQACIGTALPLPYRSFIWLIQGCRTVCVHPFQLWTTWLNFTRFGVIVMTMDVTQNATLFTFLQLVITCQKCKLLTWEWDYGRLLNFVSFRRVIFL